MHKRRHGRVRAHGVGGHLRSGESLLSATTVVNLSMGGALLRTEAPLPVGTPVVLDLVRPGLKKPIRLTGRVVSLRGEPGTIQAGMGIAFDPLPSRLARRLSELLRALAPDAKALDGDRHGFAEPPPPPPEAFGAPDEHEESGVHDAITKPIELLPDPSPEELITKRFEVPREQLALERALTERLEIPAIPPVLLTPRPSPEPARPPEASSAAATAIGLQTVTVPQNAKLMVQVRGLLMELSEAQDKASRLERENEQLRDEVAKLTAELETLRRF